MYDLAGALCWLYTIIHQQCLARDTCPQVVCRSSTSPQPSLHLLSWSSSTQCNRYSLLLTKEEHEARVGLVPTSDTLNIEEAGLEPGSICNCQEVM